MSGNWGDIWNLAMMLLGRETVEAQILIWLGVAFVAAVFIEGLRSTFFARRAHGKSEPSPTPAAKKSLRVSAPQARLWRVIEVARNEDGAPDYVAAASQTARNARRRTTTIRRQQPSRPGIHRRPAFTLSPEPSFTMEMPSEPQSLQSEGGDLRRASPVEA